MLMLQMMLLLLLFSVVPSSANQLALLSGTLRTFQRHACDQSSLALHCPAHTTIDVLYAHYGRPSLGTRPAATTAGAPSGSSSAPGGAGGMMRDEATPPYDPCPPIPGKHEAPRPGVGCVLKEAGSYEVLQRVVRDCQHKQQCRLQVAPDTFLKTDPCLATRKYVEVAYKCRPATFINKVVCEGEQHTLRCEPNSRLAVYSVLFGRTLKGTVQCPQPDTAPDEECQASYATELVMQSCQGKRSCQLVADASRLGGRPCSALSRMYMKTVYTCVPRSILKASYLSSLEADEDPQLEMTTSDHSPLSGDPVTTTSSSTDHTNDQHYHPNNLQNNPSPSSNSIYPSSSDVGGGGHNSNRLPHPEGPLGHPGKGRARPTDDGASPSPPGEGLSSQSPSFPFFNPTIKPPPHTRVKEIDELSYRQHDQQQLPGTRPDLINCTVAILAGSKEREIGFITEWMRAVGFVSRNLEKFTLYLVLGLCCGLVTLLGVVVARLMLDRRRDAGRNKANNEQLTSVFSPEIEEVDGDLDMTAPIGCSSLSRGGHSPSRCPSPLPLPEVVRYNTTPRGIVTIRRQDSDIIVPPRSLSRTNNNQLFYS